MCVCLLGVKVHLVTFIINDDTNVDAILVIVYTIQWIANDVIHEINLLNSDTTPFHCSIKTTRREKKKKEEQNYFVPAFYFHKVDRWCVLGEMGILLAYIHNFNGKRFFFHFLRDIFFSLPLVWARELFYWFRCELNVNNL